MFHVEPLQLLGGSNPQALVLCPRGSSLCLCHHLLLCRLCRADRTGALLPCPPWPSLGLQAFPGDWAVTSWLNVLPFPLGDDIDQPWSTPVQGGAPSLCLRSSPTVMGLLQCRVLTPLQSRFPDLTSVLLPSLPHQGLRQQQLTPAGDVCAVRGQL